MKITINFDNLQEADDGNTTHYGGFVLVNDTQVPATGTDRDTAMPCAIENAIRAIIGRDLTENDQTAIDENLTYQNCEFEL
jgi:hypothetical protein